MEHSTLKEAIYKMFLEIKVTFLAFNYFFELKIKIQLFPKALDIPLCPLNPNCLIFLLDQNRSGIILLSLLNSRCIFRELHFIVLITILYHIQINIIENIDLEHLIENQYLLLYLNIALLSIC
jgi:hypothetical protein